MNTFKTKIWLWLIDLYYYVIWLENLLFFYISAQCPPGTYSETGLEPCAPCPTNFFQPSEGQTTCMECAANHRTLRPGALSPEACTPG